MQRPKKTIEVCVERPKTKVQITIPLDDTVYSKMVNLYDSDLLAGPVEFYFDPDDDVIRLKFES